MKLFTKISLIVAAVAGGLGILAIIIGLVMGANVYDLNDMGIYISPQQLELSGVITEAVEESLVKEVEEMADEIVEKENFHTSTTHHRDRHHNEKLHNYTCDFRGIKRLEVDVQNAQITIFATENANEFTYYSNRGNSIATVDGSTLKLEDKSNIKDKVELELYIPVGVLKEIEIEAINGNLVADKIVADNVTIEIDNASVQIEELMVEDKAELQINAGQMVVGFYSGTNLETECAMGSIMVVCEGKQEDYNYDLECGMGQIRIQDNIYSGIGNDLQTSGESNKSIKAECAMGEIILEFPNHL